MNKEIARINTNNGAIVLVARDGKCWWETAHRIGPVFRRVHAALVWGLPRWLTPDAWVDDLDGADEATTPCEIGVVDRDGAARTLRLTRDGWGWRFIDIDKGWAPDGVTTHRNLVQCMDEIVRHFGDNGVVAL